MSKSNTRAAKQSRHQATRAATRGKFCIALNPRLMQAKVSAAQDFLLFASVNLNPLGADY